MSQTLALTADSGGLLRDPRHGHIGLLLGRRWRLDLPRPGGVASSEWVHRPCELLAKVVPILHAKPI